MPSSSTKSGTDANLSDRKSILPLDVTKALLQPNHTVKQRACRLHLSQSNIVCKGLRPHANIKHTSYRWLGVAVRACTPVAIAAVPSHSLFRKSSIALAATRTTMPSCSATSTLNLYAVQHHSHISTGAPCAILPTSSSVCITFLILPANGLDLTVLRLLLMMK